MPLKRSPIRGVGKRIKSADMIEIDSDPDDLEYEKTNRPQAYEASSDDILSIGMINPEL